jgi:amino acid adenylation domain-containing protein
MNEKNNFDLTQVQLAYVIGRNENIYLGGNSTHFYFEASITADIEKFEKALNKVIMKQSMLRTVIYDDGTQNEFNGDTYYKIDVIDVKNVPVFSECDELYKYRAIASNRVFPLNCWPMFAVRAFDYGDNNYQIAMDFDMLIMDRFSIDLFLNELYEYYMFPEKEVIVPKHSFREYMTKKKDHIERHFEEDKKFWEELIPTLPPAPSIPYCRDVRSGTKFSYEEYIMPSEQWALIKEELFRNRITPSVYVLVCYAKMLSIWGNSPSLTINMTSANRKIDKEIYNDIIGDFTELLLIDFDFISRNENAPDNCRVKDILEVCKETQTKLRKYIKHSSYSAIEVIKNYAKQHNGNADFYFAYTSRIVDNSIDNYNGLIIKRGYQISQTPQLLIDCQISEQDGELYIRWDHIHEAFDNRFFSDMYNAFVGYISNCIYQKDKISDELEKAVCEYNNTKAEIPHTTLQELFCKQAAAFPEKAAVYAGGKCLTYKELDDMSTIIAARLLKTYGSGKKVGINARRDRMTIVNMLGILKAGCAYIPIEPTYPDKRRESILSQGEAVDFLDVDFYDSIKNEPSTINVNFSVAGSYKDDAYIIFTSGSTGEPKGVVITQDAVCNTILDINKKFNITEKDNIIGISSFCFDLSVYDVFGALSAGAELVIAEDVFDTENIRQLMDEHKITFWNTVPAIMEMYINSTEKDYSFSHLRNVLLSGDWIPLGLPDEIKRKFPYASVTSLGGATEGSIWSIYFPIKENEPSWKSIPYGYPLSNQTMYVMDYNGNPSPFDSEGEICIGGRGVARCYQGREKLTAERYTFHPVYGRIYHTGDYGIFHRNKCIEFIGRKDSQVKIRGFRVELGEIQAALNKYDNVKESVADVYESATGTQYLLAYVVLDDINKSINEDEIKKSISEHLPKYMVPSHIFTIDSIPLTANGKVDKKRLPHEITESESMFAAPETDMEKMLLKIIEQISGCTNVSVNTSIFDLGIDSVKAIRMVSALKEKGYVTSLTQLYQDEKIRNIAVSLENLSSDTDENKFTISPQDKWKPFKLTPLQESYFIGRISNAKNNALPTGGYIELECNEYDHEKMQFCIRKMIARHDILRCAIHEDGTQRFIESVDAYNVELFDLTDMNKSEKEKSLNETRRVIAESKLDISKPPLIVVKASLIEKDTAILHVYLDGLIIDGWGTEIFISELASLYTTGKYLYAPFDVTFRDYVDFLEYTKTTKKYLNDKLYWQEREKELPDGAVLPLLKDPDDIEELKSAQIPCHLSINEWNKLEEAAKQHRVTTFAVLFTAFAYVMSRWSNKKRFLLNIPEFDVPDFHEDYNKVMGVCSSFILITIDIDFDKSIFENVKNIQSQILELKDHSSYSGMEVIHDIYRMSGKKNSEALVPFVFGMVMETGGMDSFIPDDKKEVIKLVYQENHTAKILIDINTIKYEDHVEFNWNYIDGALDRQMLNDMADIQMNIIRNLINSDKTWDNSINIPLPKKDQKIISAANDTDEAFEFVSMPILLENSMKKYSDRIYLNTIDKSYTYKEIYDMCMCLGSQLKAKGCGHGDHIAVHMEKSVEQIIAILSIVLIGAVYVPIEFGYPSKLVVKCSKNTDCKLIIASDSASEKFTDNDIEVLYLKKDELIGNSVFEVSPVPDDSLLVIIHTSGSTGDPKPVMVGQKGLLNSLVFTNKRFDVSSDDSAIALTNIAHDMSMYDIFGMLIAGASVTLPYEKDSKNPNEWISLIKKYKVTIWNSVPAMQEMLKTVITNEQLNDISSLKLIIHGGDYLKPVLADWICTSIKNCVLVNVGGPTETTLWNIYHVVTSEDIASKQIPYGKPISNTKYYVLNENLQPLPVGVTGTMYCAGIGVTKGYYNNQQLTDEKYIIYPETGERIYKTGDMGMYVPDGDLMFMGREDNQVKINGKRIELSGIASVVMELEDVKECEVYIKDEKEIVAYYTSEITIDDDVFRNHIDSTLPVYMMPKYFVHADHIIYKPNGKADKNAIINAYPIKNVHTDQSTLNKVEQRILDMYMEQLGVAIGIDTDLYMAGGDSILILNMFAVIQEEFGIEADLSEFFGFSTVREIAKYIEEILGETK